MSVKLLLRCVLRELRKVVVVRRKRGVQSGSNSWRIASISIVVLCRCCDLLRTKLRAENVVRFRSGMHAVASGSFSCQRKFTPCVGRTTHDVKEARKAVAAASSSSRYFTMVFFLWPGAKNGSLSSVTLRPRSQSARLRRATEVKMIESCK